ncbi:hypothetical protein [Nocardiopsis sp. NRRL B-16309]|uniref:hypothetical protein n=1 Tax=Nocardiopsis sp. NRRL B-16309 TaxID=1519494 RepID=UPI0006ADE7E5|nr:hypothetical protein [Nocardiopsis sp. NRRL B-16309]KOX14216.1 hypothetical protein ADL05_16480 [Nocardiopsis sp. NRRL B-16309]
MNATTKLGLYVLGLVAVFAVMFGAGSLAGPVLPERTQDTGHAEDQGHEDTAGPDGAGGHDHTDTER